MVTLRLVEGVVLRVGEEYDHVRAAVEEARANGGFLEVRDPTGRAMTINADHVVYVDGGVDHESTLTSASPRSLATGV